MSQTAKDYQAALVAKNLTTAGAQFVMPWSTIRPSNPENYQYLPVGNNSAYPSVAVIGQKAPRLAVASYFKAATWSTAANFNALMMTLDSNGDSNFLSFAIYDPFSTTFRIFDWAKCNQIDFAGSATGGPQTVNMGFDPIFGDSENAGSTINGFAPTTFTSSGVAPDSGLLTASTAVQLSGATKVRSYRMTLTRGQLPQFYFTGNRYASDISSGQFSGLLTLEIEPNGTAPTGTVTITIGGVNFAMYVNRDELFRGYNPTFGTTVLTYSLINLSAGGSPLAIS